jgi:hypothetical protein
MRIIKLFCCFACLLVSEMAISQTMWKYFSPEDFDARRKKVMEKIGDGILVLQAAEMTEAYIKFRQDNNFYYLTGVEVPDAVLIIDGKKKESYLLVPDYISNDIKTEALIKPGEKDAAVYKQQATVFPATVPPGNGRDEPGPLYDDTYQQGERSLGWAHLQRSKFL